MKKMRIKSMLEEIYEHYKYIYAKKISKLTKN